MESNLFLIRLGTEVEEKGVGFFLLQGNMKKRQIKGG